MVVIFVVVLSLFIFFLVGQLSNDKSDFYLIFDTSNMFIKDDNGWMVSDDTDNIPNEKFAIYENGKYLGSYYLQYNNRFFVYDSNKKVIKIEGELLAYNGGKRLKVIYPEFDVAANDDYEYLDSVRSFLGIDDNEKVSLTKYEYDINNDKKDETIYIANVYIDNYEYYTLMFLNDDDVTVLKRSNSSDDIYTLNYLIDYDNDKRYELVVLTDVFSNPSLSCYTLFGYDDSKKMIKLVGC